MSKEKSSEKGVLCMRDHMGRDARIYEKCQENFFALAGFYGFEKIILSLIEDAYFFLPLAKTRFLNQRIPVALAHADGEEVWLSFSGALSVIRAYAMYKMNDLPHPLRFAYYSPSFFRLPQNYDQISGREELGLMMIGEENAVAEAEIALIIWKTLEELKIPLEALRLELNATGCAQCYPQFRSSLMSYLRTRAGRMCKDCKQALKSSPTRVFSCGEERCAMIANHAPQLLDFLCDECKKHLKGFLEFLDEVEIPYFLEGRLFREGSWLGSIIFECAGALLRKEESDSGAPHTVSDASQWKRTILAEGGRMSKIGELLLGKRLDVAVGTLFLDQVGVYAGIGEDADFDIAKPKVFLTQLGEYAKRRSLKILETLRKNAIPARESLGRDSIKSQLKTAEHLGVEITLVVGQKEALDETVIVREMDSGVQETVPQEKLIEFLKRKLKK
ncbi:MAG: histidyl-tRNA synthetase [Parcubacteria group bacterium Gr01-1014_33]|nr:MAG: histidyl-tRNA synthetase [Parcubacteria group bacterium Gr01-1014_33]